MTSKARHQLELLPSQQAHEEKVTPDLIARVKRRTTLLDAWKYAQEISCLDDKTIYEQLKIDGSHWTKIKNGRASPPADERFTRYMEVVRNHIPAIWLVEALGYDWASLRPHRSDLQRENERLRQELAERDRAIALILGHQGRK